MNLIPVMELNGFNVFLAIAAVGFLFLLISLFFGGIFDHFDAGLDHGVEHGGPGFFSTRIISVFVMSFGAFGAISTHYGLDPLPAVPRPRGCGSGLGVDARAGRITGNPLTCPPV